MIEILEPGPLTSVQTASGRPGWRRFGVPVGGAADAWSARLGNRLVGNPDDAALFEVTLGGAVARFRNPGLAAVTGGLSAILDGLELPASVAVAVRSGSVIRFGPGAGARGYLAVAGGVAIEPVLGSAATDLRSGFGGVEGRALRAGDRIAVGSGAGRPHRWSGSRTSGPIRIVAGPQAEGVTLEGPWVIGAEADRTGVRLDGRRLDGAEVPSMGIPLGAIQVPPDGRPIVMLADRPVTGGYPVPACVIRADVGRVAQLRPGDALTFASVSMEEAREAMRLAEAELAALHALVTPEDDELGWAGSHE